jgi:hypothetical protein
VGRYFETNIRQLQEADLTEAATAAGFAIVITDQANPWSFQANTCVMF